MACGSLWLACDEEHLHRLQCWRDINVESVVSRWQAASFDAQESMKEDTSEKERYFDEQQKDPHNDECLCKAKGSQGARFQDVCQQANLILKASCKGRQCKDALLDFIMSVPDPSSARLENARSLGKSYRLQCWTSRW